MEYSSASQIVGRSPQGCEAPSRGGAFDLGNMPFYFFILIQLIKLFFVVSWSFFFFCLVSHVGERPWWPIQSLNKGRRKKEAKGEVERERSDQVY